MTPSERERRLKAAWHAYWQAGPSFTAAGDKHAMRAALDAADEAVPVVSQRAKDEQQEILDRQFWDMRTAWVDAEQRAEKAEAAARDIAKEAFRGGFERGVSSGSLAPRDFSGLEHHWRTWCHEAGFPSFSGEEGTEG